MSDSAALNDAIFKLLADPAQERRAADALNTFTRSLMYHKFTGMPKRGMIHRIMPPILVADRAYWAARGVPAEQLVGTEPYLHPWWDDGSLLYEIMENRLAREDYERRLAARQVTYYEWELRHRRSRYSKKKPPAHAAQEYEAVADAAAGRIVAQLRTLGRVEPV